MAKNSVNKLNEAVDVSNIAKVVGSFYLLTYIGAAVYFVGLSNGFWEFVLALLKAFVWPAYVVERALELLQIS